MDPRINIGIDDAKEADITIEWPTGGITLLEKVSANTIVVANENDKREKIKTARVVEKKSLFKKSKTVFPATHRENNFVDFHRERLLYHMCSNEGPVSSHGDINNDGYLDFILPGTKNNPTKIFLGVRRKMAN